MQYMAEYRNFSNPASAQELLLAARNLNSGVMQPINGIQFLKSNCPTNGQAVCAKEYIENSGLDNNEYILHVSAILDDLKFSDGPASRFEQALKQAVSVIGILSLRPEVQFGGEAPDNLLALGNGEYVIIECKNRTTTGTISKSDCGQLLSAVQWFKNKYLCKEKYIPVIIHNSDTFSSEASPSSDMRVMTPKLLEEFSLSIKKFAEGVMKKGTAGNIVEIEKLLNIFHLNGKEIINHYTKKFNKNN